MKFRIRLKIDTHSKFSIEWLQMWQISGPFHVVILLKLNVIHHTKKRPFHFTSKSNKYILGKCKRVKTTAKF